MKKAIILSMMLALVLSGCGAEKVTIKILQPEEAKAKITDFINNELLAGAGYQATVESITEEKGLYKMSVDVNNQKLDTYMTRDGAIFFPQAIEVEKDEAAGAAQQQASAPTIQEVNKKTAKPEIELFVMSHCPYGTQIEKGILPVLDTLKDKVVFNLRFCDYAMHGQTELNEELAQYCIQKNEPHNLQAYLKCFLEAGDSASCLKTANINEAKLKTCVAATDKTYNVTSGFNDETTWLNGRYPQFNVYKDDNDKYGIQGSPALVINGEKISSARDSESLLKTICSAFEQEPNECQAGLSSETPSAGFGYGTASGSTDASCQ